MATRITAETLVTADETVYSDGVAVRVDDGIVTDAGPAEDVPEDADEQYDLPGHTLLPGLIDAHVHLGTVAHPDIVKDTLEASPAERTVRAVKNARATVEAGITTVRDLASLDDVAIQVRDEVAAGNLVGPRIIAVGNGLLPTGGHGCKTPWYWPDDVNDLGRWRVADGPTEIRTAVREQVERGADAIKVWATGGVIDPEGIDVLDYSPEELNVLVDEANRHHREVAAHAHPPEAIEACVEAGARSIEHGTYMDRTSIDVMADNDAYVTLTRSTIEAVKRLDGVPDYYHDNAVQALDHQATMVPRAHEKGIIAMGTDTGAVGMHHGENAIELQYMVEAGLSPLDAIEVSTRNTAEMLDIGDEVGQLKPGYAADIIAVDGDPTVDISLVTDDETLDFVMADGTVVRDDTD